MEGCLYFILFAIALFAFAAALSVVIATIMSIFTLIVYRRWGWSNHFMRVFTILMDIASFILRATPSSSSSSRSSGGSFGGGSSRGGGSGRNF